MKKNSKESSIDLFCRWVDRYLNFEKTPKKNIFWLKTMEFLAEKLKNPQNFCPCIHVAGSKGKGSVSAMITSILTEAGFKTGVYSSPHILNFVERIQSGRGSFSEEVYEKSYQEILSCVESIRPDEFPGKRPLTWFELVTLFAFLCFKNASCDWSVYEVGLGGRLDATNIILPKVCAIGPIELEHTEFLGNTLEAIAGEKAGIIKENIPVFVAPQKDCVKKVFLDIASKKKAPIKFVDEFVNISDIVYNNRLLLDNIDDKINNNSINEFNCIKKNTNKQSFNIEKDCNCLQKNDIFMSFSMKSCAFNRPLNIKLKLLGSFQAQNAALAALAVKSVLPDLSEDIIERGLFNACLPGRFEIADPGKYYKGIRALVLDGAHTVNSVSFTMDTFKNIFNLAGVKCPCVLLFAAASDKDVEDIAPVFRNVFDEIILTRPGDVKQSDLPRLERAFKGASLPYRVQEDYSLAIRQALSIASEKGGILLVTGSFYLIAEVKKILMDGTL